MLIASGLRSNKALCRFRKPFIRCTPAIFI
jgi:hypothetical protein